MKCFVGTSGYSYKQWKGVFYPEKLPNDQMLEYYGSQLPAVEINNTFYRMPKSGVLESWRAHVPASFRFSIKASRRITHIKRMKDVEDDVGYLLKAVASLEKKLGVILFQFPPNLKKDLDRLQRFLDLLPETVQSALEFRNASWFEDDVLELLRSRMCALCIEDTDEEFSVPVVATAPWTYLRLRRATYTKDDMKDCSQGLECGIGIENFNDIKLGDVIESYEVEEVQARLT